MTTKEATHNNMNKWRRNNTSSPAHHDIAVFQLRRTAQQNDFIPLRDSTQFLFEMRCWSFNYTSHGNAGA